MSIEKLLLPMPFAGGIDTKTDPKQVLPTKLLALQNGIFSQTGAVTRRWGYSALSMAIVGGGAIAACVAIESFGSELILLDGQNLYSYIEGAQAWASRGAAPSIIQTNANIIRNTSQQLSPDFGTNGGVNLYAWEDSRGGIRTSLFDAATGTAILVDQPLSSTGIRPKVIAFGSLLYVFFGFPSTASIDVAVFNPAAPQTAPTIASLTLATAPATPVLFDACSSSVAGQIYLAYYAAGATKLVALTGTTTLTVAWTETPAASAGTACLGVCTDPSFGGAYVASSGSSTTTGSTWAYSPSGSLLATVASAITLSGGSFVAVALCASSASSQAQVRVTSFWDYALPSTSTAPAIESVYFAEALAGNTTITTSGTVMQACGLASKPAIVGSNILINLAFSSPLQSTYFAVQQATPASSSSPPVIVASTQTGLGGGYLSASDYMVPELVQVSSGVFRYANLAKDAPNTEAGQVIALLGVAATTLNTASTAAYSMRAIQDILYIGGGILLAYDGAQVVESNFLVGPEQVAYSCASTGGNIAPGTYGYSVNYEWENNEGGTDYSTPSPVTLVTIPSGTSTNEVSISVPCLFLTRKSNVKIVIYRTINAGTLLYRVTSAIVPTYNNPGARSVTFVDTLADADIQSNGLDYTQPMVTTSATILENVPPPASIFAGLFDDRLWLLATNDAYTLWYSQQALAGQPMQFCAELTFQVDPDGPGITAIRRMDANLIIFKANAIYYVSGTGPDATGQNNGYSPPASIPSAGVGCTNPRSIVELPIGLLFQSANGIYLLDRGLNVSYKGAPVESYTSPEGQGLVVTSATLVPNQWAVFTTSGGTALVYDYFYDQWSTFTNHAAVDSVAAELFAEALCWASASGQVFVQTPAGYSDNGTAIPFSLQTAHISPGAAGGSLQGFQRVYHAFLLGQYIGPHTLTVEASYDYQAPATVATILVSADPAPYQFRVDLLTKCQSFQLTISDAQSAPGNQGFSLSGLTYLVGIKGSGVTVPVTKQF